MNRKDYKIAKRREWAMRLFLIALVVVPTFLYFKGIIEDDWYDLHGHAWRDLSQVFANMCIVAFLIATVYYKFLRRFRKKKK